MLPFAFIGVMRSRAKIATIFEQLRQAGKSESWLSCLYVSVGLPIASQIPEVRSPQLFMVMSCVVMMALGNE
ncbi:MULTISPECIES: hypothetical protein [unclassified Nostoc]|uniref:hypothetical protein n=1 Tax=unclassified Nostoc TaxID=2593658 RepID=UPI002624202B|nr:hypothetical protein [Nostoc sp. S13]MDF5736372.1 hypothetical protein [Nostoc sp. S13]